MIDSNERIKEYIESTKLKRNEEKKMDYEVIRLAKKRILRAKIEGRTKFIREWDAPKELDKKSARSRQRIIDRSKRLASRQDKLAIDKIKSSNDSLIKIHTKIPRLYILAIFLSSLLIINAFIYHKNSIYEFHILIIGGLGTIVVSLIGILEILWFRQKEQNFIEI